VLDYLQSHLRKGDKLVGERLPHHVAVCITKFDDPALFDTALRTGWVSTHPGTGQPYVPNSHADRFFAWLCAQLPGTGANRVRAALRKYFHEDRVAYFVCSAIGFRIGPGGLFDSRDYANVTIVNGEPRIREAVHPINVLEPVIALERRIRTGSW
jgi:hypothetical protein